MTAPPKPPKTPNADIDTAIKAMMKQVSPKDASERLPPDIAVKVINTAIAWEKVKHGIKDKDGPDPDVF